MYGGKQGLRFEKSEVQITKEITSVDLGGADLVRGFEKERSEPSVQAVPSRSGDRRPVALQGLEVREL
jgi:hypothetical protein